MYTAIPNDFIAMLPQLSGTEITVMLAIYRSTIGWHRDNAVLSLSTLVTMTGCSRRQINEATQSLVQRKFITATPTLQGMRYTVSYGYVVGTSQPEAEIAIAEIAIAEIAPEVEQKLPTNKEIDKEIHTSSETVEMDLIIQSAPVSQSQSPKRSRRKKDDDGNPKEVTVCTIFRDIHRLNIPIAIRDSVKSRVTDLEKWTTVCTEWIARGYRPGNVEGCIQVYENGWRNHGRSTTSSNQRQRGDVQKQRREERMAQNLAEYFNEDTP